MLWHHKCYGILLMVKNMELKAFEILNIYETLVKLADKELDLNTACTIAKNLKETHTAKEVIDKKRDKIVLKYADKDEDGNAKQFDDGHVEISDKNAFAKEIDEMLNTYVTVDIKKIQMDALSEIKISPKDILHLIGTIMEG